MKLTIKQQLERPFDAHRIHWRVGATTRDKTKCIPLAYIDARDVMQRLDAIVGEYNWQCEYPLADSGLLICKLGIYFDDRKEWIWKSNGAGDTHVEAEKGKCSDAFKRAAVLWGIGRYLYALPNQWVKMENNRIPKAILISLGETLPVWATPEGYDNIIKKRNAE